MGWTKRQLIDAAFRKAGLAAYVFDLTPDNYQAALQDMDSMVAGWAANGVRIAYPLAGQPGSSDIDNDSNVPDWAVEAIYMNLALRIAPDYGKTVSPEVTKFADMSYNNMTNQSALPTMERQMPRTMPRGQGTKPWRNFNNPFVYGPSEEVQVGSDENLDLE